MTKVERRGRTVYRPAAARAVAFGWFAIAAVVAADIVVRGEGRSRLVALAVVLTVTVAAYGFMFRPAVEIDDERVTLRNVFRDWSIPWPLVTDVTARWSLTVHTRDRKFGSWAVTGRGMTDRERARRAASVTEIDDRRRVDFAGFVIGQVSRRWREHPRPRASGPAQVEQRWAWEFIVPLAVSLAVLTAAIAA